MTSDTANAAPESPVESDTNNVTDAPLVPQMAGADTSADWPVIDEAAYHGLAGEVMRTIEPHTEADPVAILLQVLTYFGNVVGRGPYYQVESDRHHANLFCVLVGRSAKGRNGTSGGRARAVMQLADQQWLGRMKGI